MASFYSVPGAAATVQVGTVTTVAPENAATVTNSGTPTAAVLNFNIPRGITGNVAAAGDGTAALPSITFANDVNTGFYRPGPDQVAVATNGTGRLFVNASGRVGIGTASSFSASAPLDDFHIASTDPAVLLEETDAGTDEKYWRIRADGSILRFEGINDTFSNSQAWLNVTRATGSRNTDNIAFSTGTSERLRITSAGLVGIGTSAPDGILTIGGTQASGVPALDLSPYNANNATTSDIVLSGNGCISASSSISNITTGTGFFAWYNNATADNTGIDGATHLMRLDGQGRLGIGAQSPAQKLHVFEGSGSVTTQISTSTHALRLTADDTLGGVEIRNASSGPIAFSRGTSAGESARIDSSGRLLVGTSTAVADASTVSRSLQVLGNNAPTAGQFIARFDNGVNAPALVLGKSRGATVGTYTVVNSGDQIGRLAFDATDGTKFVNAALIAAEVDGTPGTNDMPGRLVFSVTADGASSPTERLRINNSGAIGFNGANFGTAGQALVSNGSTAPPTWQSISPTTVFGWNHTNDNYGLYLPGTSIRSGDLSGTVDIDVQSRLRRCVINDAGVVQYYLDADDSTLKAGDWLRIVETESLTVAYTGTTTETTNSLLRVGVPAWAAGTFTRGQRVTHNGSLWECVVASTTATPAAGTVASDLTGTDGQVMVEVPAFSVRYGFSGGVHTREVRLGCNDSLIAQGFQPHPAFIKTDGTYKSAFYIGAYQVTGTSPATTVSGASNRVSMTRATQRAASAARGTGWHVLSYFELAAIQTLMVTEFRDMNTQRAIGNGAQEGSVYVVNTGLSNGQGNKSANAYTSGGSTSDYVSYRGLENIYGRAWQWVDGFNVYERVAYLTNDQSSFADNTSVGYKVYAQVPSGSASYQKELFPLPDVFLPSVVTGASSTSYLGDAFWTGTGWRVALVGGRSGDGARVGAFALSLYNASSYANAGVSARLAYAVN